MKKNKGFSLVELLVVIAMLAVLMGLALVSFGPSNEFSAKTMVNTNQKILVNAIDSWVSDNSNATQRPANFFSENAQGHPVYKYIDGNDVFRETNLNKDGTIKIDSSSRLKVSFEKGVLTVKHTDNSGNDDVVKKFFVFPTKNKNANEVDEYAHRIESHQLIDKEYEAM